MTLMVIKAFLSKSWLWLKNHWQVPLMLAWTLLVYIMSRRNSDAMIEVLDAKKDSYNKQLEELRKRHANEIAEREKILSEYHKTISEIEKKYEEDKRKLTFLEKRKVKQEDSTQARCY